jgi:hypothetical protein
MTLSKLNRTLSFCEAEIKNAFQERFNRLLAISFRFRCCFSKTRGDLGGAKFLNSATRVTITGNQEGGERNAPDQKA